MKSPRSPQPPVAIPRLGSLLHRLRQTSGPADQPYLDQLMIYLEAPPPGTRDRWKQGAKMCTRWGVSCTGASVWRLYRSYVLEWRLRLAHETDATATESVESLAAKTARMVDLRVYELLANPDAPVDCLVSLARIELRKKAFEFARHKYRQNELRERQKADEGRAAIARFMTGLNPASPDHDAAAHPLPVAPA